MWPNAADYHEAVQNLATQVEDEELRAGQAELNSLGMPALYSGNFADVYRVHSPQTGNTWAVKCFTRQVPGLRDRYRLISQYLAQAKLPFMVDFQYLERGVRVRSDWFPVLKMRWVEGVCLNKFVEQALGKPQMLRQLADLWVRLADRLQQAQVTHADLQHGNVVLVPVPETGQLRLSLIDYDGMYLPPLADQPSGELGHPAYQHPQRLREQAYCAEVDRFSHLVIYTATRCLAARRGRELWDRFNNQENLLFTESDFRQPSASALFHELQQLRRPAERELVGHLLLASQAPLTEVPLLSELVVNGEVRPLTFEQRQTVDALLKSSPSTSDSPEALYPVLAELVAEPLGSDAVTSSPFAEVASESPGSLAVTRALEIAQRERRRRSAWNAPEIVTDSHLQVECPFCARLAWHEYHQAGQIASCGNCGGLMQLPPAALWAQANDAIRQAATRFARSQVDSPAVLLIVFSLLGLILWLFVAAKESGTASLVALASAAYQGGIIAGAISLRKLRFLAIARISSCMAFGAPFLGYFNPGIYCFPTYLLLCPFGIWAFVVLTDVRVSSAFPDNLPSLDIFKHRAVVRGGMALAVMLLVYLSYSLVCYLLPSGTSKQLFNGDTYLTINNSDDFHVHSSDYTIVARVKAATGGTIFAKTPAGHTWAPGGHTFMVRGRQAVLDVGWVGYVQSGKQLDAANWHQVAVTHSVDGRVQMYQDGNLLREGRLESIKSSHGLDARIGFTADNFPRRSLFEGDIEFVVFYDRILSTAEIKTVMDRRFPSGAVAHWDLRQLAGKTVPDLTGNGHNATIVRRSDTPLVHWKCNEGRGVDLHDAAGQRHATVSGTAMKWVGEDPRALHFGGDNFIAVPDLGEQDAFTIALWVCPERSPANLVSLIHNNGWSQRGVHFHFSQDGSVGLGINGNDSGLQSKSDVRSKGRLVFQKWQHLAVTYDRRLGQATFYLNGQRDIVREYKKSLRVVIGPGRIGSYNLDGGSRWFHGSLADVRIYSRALDDQEIAAIATRPTTGTMDSAESLNQFVFPGPGTAKFEYGELRLTKRSTSRAVAVYGKYFKNIDSVTIRGRIVPPEANNFRVAVGKVHLLLNWEYGGRSHNRFGVAGNGVGPDKSVPEVAFTTTPAALVPGKMHEIRIARTTEEPERVEVTIDGKHHCFIRGKLEGTVSIYGPNLGIRSFEVVGTIDPSRQVTGPSERLP